MPVFSFGENDVSLNHNLNINLCAHYLVLFLFFPILTQIFEQMRNEHGTVLYMLQKRFQAMFGFTLPLFHGRGMLNCASCL